jgi:hypothetical protein
MIVTSSDYRDQVMSWGNLSPWSKLGIRLKHKVSFDPRDVVRDGRGNIIKMPVLPAKPCFGRPEVFFRHGGLNKTVTLGNGRTVKATKHQCGACPAGVRLACAETAYERVQSDDGMRSAFNAWFAHCRSIHPTELFYTGSASRPWGDFKKAVAARGPFFSSNDEELEKLAIEEEVALREKWRTQQCKRRDRQRAELRAARKPPTKQFVLNVQDERDRRLDALLGVLGQPDQPKSRRNVHPGDRQSTATIMANAWAVRETLRESGITAKPGTIARLMVRDGLNAGRSYGTLKARIAADLKRCDECERDGVWQPFDPNGDLDTYQVDDDVAADANLDPSDDLEAVLRSIGP